MKLLKLTFILNIILFSCQSDNENDTNPIIGKWRQISEIESGKDFTNKCTPLNIIEIINDGTAVSTSYSHVVEGGAPYECVFDGETESQWKINGNIIIATFIEDGKILEHESIFKIENDILIIENKPENQPIIITYERI